MCAKKQSNSEPQEIRNKKLHHKYQVEDTFEAGIVLKGTEVKAIRAGDARIAEAFCRVEGDAVVLHNAHIAEYRFGNIHNHLPARSRKLLLHKREIHRLRGHLEAGGKALIPVSMYFKHGLVKVKIALCTGKKLYDKREDMKKRVALREAERAMKAHR